LRKSDLDNYLKTASESSQLILSNLSKASDLVKSFKRVAVDQSFEEERVFLVKPYVQDVLASLSAPLRQGQHEVTVSCSDTLEIHCAAGAFYQILTNLIMNSILHGFEDKKKGRINITLSIIDDDILQIIYTDNGVGMDKETLRKVFDPFFTTKRSQGGTGLGMNIVYNLVTQKLRGSIDCNSEPGEGVTFKVCIPGVQPAGG
jgi:signal transduction histidine kinase